MLMETFIVTGGAGFIGVNFVRFVLERTQANVVVVDKLTYAGNLCSLQDLLGDSRVTFLESDIGNRKDMAGMFQEFQPTGVLNFAAETHVDRSIEDPEPFVDTNLVGTAVLLSEAWKYFRQAPVSIKQQFRFLHVSTDEVYGTLGAEGLFTEQTPYAPNSPYAATKAGADFLVRAYHETYGLPVLITNCSNNYGPYQFPEKLIPLMFLNGLEGKPLPVYGDGGHIRDWLFVEDHCEALLCVFKNGKIGEKYNIGGANERTNLEVLKVLCQCLESIAPARSNESLKHQGIKNYLSLIQFVPDRPGHDRRYGIDSTKLQSELGWAPSHSFEERMQQTVGWYMQNREWCNTVLSEKYGRERLGLVSNL